MTAQPVLQVHHLTKTYQGASGLFHAVNNVNFVLEPGEVLGILGHNGAGKTTIIQMLLGILKPTSGSIIYFQKDFATHRSAILHHIGFASSYVRLPGQLTIATNLDIYGQLYGLSAAQRAARIEELLKFFGMWNMADKETGTLSAGQMTRVMLAKAFLAQPAIVLLDEPTASLDPEYADHVRSFIVEQQKTAKTSLLITSHNMEEVTSLCNRVLVLKHGQVIANDTPQTLAMSIAQARVHLFSSTPQALIEYLHKHHYTFSQQAERITMSIEEQHIPTLLTKLALEGITYTQISIDPPTLRDYFKSITEDQS